jgi:hypothetical protein
VPDVFRKEIDALKILAPGLYMAGYQLVCIRNGKLVNVQSSTESSTETYEDCLKVELSEEMLNYLREYKTEQPKPTSSLYMVESSPFPVFIRTTLDPSVDHRLMGLSRVIDTRDPVTMEELSFHDATFWKNIYNQLRNACVDVCPRGHVVSFETLCSFMNDDGWSHDEAGNITKVKCPCCRMRFPIHDTLPLLCNFFAPIVEADKQNTDKNRKTKDDQIGTYFSTEDDEDEDLEELRRLVLESRDEDNNEGGDEEEGEDSDSDEDYEDSIGRTGDDDEDSEKTD